MGIFQPAKVKFSVPKSTKEEENPNSGLKAIKVPDKCRGIDWKLAELNAAKEKQGIYPRKQRAALLKKLVSSKHEALIASIQTCL